MRQTCYVVSCNNNDPKIRLSVLTPTSDEYCVIALLSGWILYNRSWVNVQWSIKNCDPFDPLTHGLLCLLEQTMSLYAYCHYRLVGWLSGRTSVSDRRTFTGLHRTCSWWVTIYMGKPSAVCQLTRPSQPFILTGSISE